MSKSRSLFVLLILPLALIGAAGVVCATARGAASSIDSVTYVGAARSLLQGHGYQALAYDGSLQPMTHYPPLFPTLLALPGLLGVDPLDGARWLNALLMGINIVLGAASVMRFSRGALWSAVIAALLALAAPTLMQVHAWAWAEPLFLALGLVAFLLLDRYVAGYCRAALWLAGACLGLACLTRYTGLALVATAALWVLWGGPGRTRRRLADAALLVGMGVLPLGFWFARNLSVSGGLANRQVVYHIITRAQLAEGLSTLSQWVLPGQAATGWPGLALIAAFVVVGVGGAVALRRRASAERPGPDAGRGSAYAPLLPGLFVLVYLLALLVSISFFDAHTPLDDRILVPVFVCGLIYLWSLAGALLAGAHWSAPAAAVVAGLLLAGLAAPHNVGYVRHLHANGAGYAAGLWTESALMQQVRALPPDTPLVSNVPDGIYILTGRPAAWLPYEVHAGTRQNNDAFAAEIEALAADYGARDGRLVYFRAGTWRWYLPALETLKQTIPLVPVSAAPDGEILRFAEGQ